MEKEIKDKLIKRLDKAIEYNAAGIATIKSVQSIIDAVDEAVARVYADRLRSIATIAKNFIFNASKMCHGENIEQFILQEELQALQYAIKLAEENYCSKESADE